MVFIGFGFLMTFLKKYGFSGLGYNFLIAALVIEWSTMMQGFFSMENNKIHIGIERYVKPGEGTVYMQLVYLSAGNADVEGMGKWFELNQTVICFASVQSAFPAVVAC